MTWSVLIPVASVVIGWALGILSQQLSDERNQKRSRGRLLAKLILLEGQISTARKAMSHLKQIDLSASEREGVRAKMLQRHFMEGPTSLDALLPLIDESAAATPIASVRLLSIIELLSKHKKTTLREMASADRNIYDRHLAIHEAGLVALHKEIRGICRAYSLRFSVFSYIGLEMRFFKSERNFKKSKNLVSIIGADYSDLLREDFSDSRA